jgi:hypothetical protein
VETNYRSTLVKLEASNRQRETDSSTDDAAADGRKSVLATKKEDLNKIRHEEGYESDMEKLNSTKMAEPASYVVTSAESRNVLAGTYWLSSPMSYSRPKDALEENELLWFEAAELIEYLESGTQHTAPE